ncbi:glycerol kinase [Batrachochytrium salamandrivorans]|nr:glycerol kinase [Batrachochytrium salamandrivorans]
MATKQAKQVLLGALDQGTTSTRFIVFDQLGNTVASAQKEHTQIMPQAGWVEHDPMEIWTRVQEVMKLCMSQLPDPKSELACIGITNQRETTICWNKHTGKPYGNAIVWMDTRTQPLCDELSSNPLNQAMVKHKTGLPISMYFSGTKIRWMLDNLPECRRDSELGLAVAGTIDSWLMFQMSGEENRCHCTDVSNASRYMLMDLATLGWDQQLCDLVGVPMAMLPTIQSSSQVYFEAKYPQCVRGVKVSGVLGDQQSALVGQCGFHPGMAKNTYGTGLFMLLNTGEELVRSDKLITTVAYQFGPKAKPVYALEGSVAIGGALVQWLRDNLGVISNTSEVEILAKQVDDTAGVCIVPAFSGLFAPHWRSDARGTITGLTRFADRRHICRAALEATALQTRDVFEAMSSTSGEGVALTELRVDGGMVCNNLLMQIQADLLDCQVTRPVVTETTALGAVYAAGLAVGVWKDVEEIEGDWPGTECQFNPGMSQAKRLATFARWNKAVAKSMDSV